jgi:hypothetical protein
VKYINNQAMMNSNADDFSETFNSLKLENYHWARLEIKNFQIDSKQLQLDDEYTEPVVLSQLIARKNHNLIAIVGNAKNNVQDSSTNRLVISMSMESIKFHLNPHTIKDYERFVNGINIFAEKELTELMAKSVAEFPVEETLKSTEKKLETTSWLKLDMLLKNIQIDISSSFESKLQQPFASINLIYNYICYQLYSMHSQLQWNNGFVSIESLDLSSSLDNILMPALNVRDFQRKPSYLQKKNDCGPLEYHAFIFALNSKSFHAVLSSKAIAQMIQIYDTSIRPKSVASNIKMKPTASSHSLSMNVAIECLMLYFYESDLNWINVVTEHFNTTMSMKNNALNLKTELKSTKITDPQHDSMTVVGFDPTKLTFLSGKKENQPYENKIILHSEGNHIHVTHDFIRECLGHLTKYRSLFYHHIHREYQAYHLEPKPLLMNISQEVSNKDVHSIAVSH